MIDIYFESLKQAVASADPTDLTRKLGRILDDSVYVPITFYSHTEFCQEDCANVSTSLAWRVLYRYSLSPTPG